MEYTQGKSLCAWLSQEDGYRDGGLKNEDHTEGADVY